MALSSDWRAHAPLVHIPRHPLWCNAYDGAWELLWRTMADASSDIQDDVCAIALFARYADDASRLHVLLDVVPRANSLPAWTEWEWYQATGDMARLAGALSNLLKHYERRTTQRRRGSGLYGDTPRAADNTPHEAFEWVDWCAQQALAAECIASSAHALAQSEYAQQYFAEWHKLCGLINERCWDERTQFYFDRRADGSLSDVKCSAGFWPLLAGVPSPTQAAALVKHLTDPQEFWRVHVCPSLSADHPRYADRGAGWRGSVWPQDNYALTKGLERYGYHDLAFRVADNHLTTISHVFKETQSLWDNYAPDYIEPGSIARPAAAGTGISAVALLLETILGLRVDAPANTLHWRPKLRETWAVEQFRVGNVRVNVSVTAERATFTCSAPLTLHISTRDGAQRFVAREQVVVAY